MKNQRELNDVVAESVARFCGWKDAEAMKASIKKYQAQLAARRRVVPTAQEAIKHLLLDS